MSELSFMQPPHSLKIKKPQSSWQIVLQSGVVIPCMVNIPLDHLMGDYFHLSDANLCTIDVFMLNGHPVDHLDKAIVRQNDRIALAAGLPGIAGLSMKKDTVLRGMRPGITHLDEENSDPPAKGHVELVLYSLALPLLAGHFFNQGVTVNAGQLVRYIRMCNLNGPCQWDGQHTEISSLSEVLTQISPDVNILLHAELH